MNRVLMCLSLILINGCTTTETITEYKERLVKPPAAYLIECQQPFYQPPKTYGEAAARDPVWLEHWQNCAEKISSLREFYGYSNADQELTETSN